MLAAELRFQAIGTHWTVLTEAPVDDVLRGELHALVEDFDRTWSRFRDDSVVTRIAAAPGRYHLPSTAGPLLTLYRRLYEATAGAMTPLVGRSLEHLGYDPVYSLRPSPGHRPAPEWDEVMDFDPASGALTTTAAVLLDVGAAGKGLLVDLISDLLVRSGYEQHLVDGSGDLRSRGPGTHRIALEDPRDTTKAIGVVNLDDGALCCSAVNRRSWAGVHHVLDGRTGAPTENVAATWVLAPTALEADGLATALFLTAPAALAEFTFGHVRIFADGHADFSPGLDGDLFT